MVIDLGNINEGLKAPWELMSSMAWVKRCYSEKLKKSQ